MNGEGDEINTDQNATISKRPRLTEELPDIGGVIKASVQDFEVVEVPAYEPCGEGPHYYLWVESRDIDGRELIDKVASHYGVRRRDLGTAGTKDKKAVTRQWISLPAQLMEDSKTPEPTRLDSKIEVLAASRHGNKLRTGHLKGNRFSIVIRETQLSGEALKQAAQAVMERIEGEGLPNYYGLQRFGHDQSNLETGLTWAKEGKSPKGNFLRRMAASAVQSEVFNRLLAKRMSDGTWKEVVDGDIFMRRDSGGRFWIQPDERDETARRLQQREIVVTGPMPGSKGGLAKGKAREVELEILAQMGLDEENLQNFGRHGKGTRRALIVYPEELSMEVVGERSLKLQFYLPTGSYATVLAREFMG